MNKNHIKRVIFAAGLARYIWRSLVARGWTRWKPLVPEEDFSGCVRAAVRRLCELEPLEAFGDYLEFGVSRGTSLGCAYHVLRDEGLLHTRLVGFDSFEGLPPEAADEGWTPKAFHSSLSATQHYLRTKGVDPERVVLVKGWFKETLNERSRQHLGLTKASLIVIDCDIYSAAVQALAFCEPHIKEHAVIIFDDWGDDAMPLAGEQKAFSEFLAVHTDISLAERLPAYGMARSFYLSRSRIAAPTRETTAKLVLIVLFLCTDAIA